MPDDLPGPPAVPQAIPLISTPYRPYVDLLAEHGVLLDEPYTRQLRGKLRELRFHLDREAVRITYWIAPGRRIIMLTVFRKQRMHESAEIERAWRAMQRCVAEAHTADEE